MRMAMVEAIQGAVLLGGILTLYLSGVRLRIDRKADEFFIEVTPDEYDVNVLRAVEQLVDDLGYEVMPEWECPAEEQDNGAIRHWMAEKEVVHDGRSALQAI